MKLKFIKNNICFKSDYSCSISKSGVIYFSKSLANVMDFKNKNYAIAVNDEDIWIDRFYFIEINDIKEAIEIKFDSGMWKAVFSTYVKILGIDKKQKMNCEILQNNEFKGFEVILQKKVYNINSMQTKQC